MYDSFISLHSTYYDCKIDLLEQPMILAPHNNRHECSSEFLILWPLFVIKLVQSRLISNSCQQMHYITFSCQAPLHLTDARCKECVIISVVMATCIYVQMRFVWFDGTSMVLHAKPLHYWAATCNDYIDIISDRIING
jgi:hypothetical protein